MGLLERRILEYQIIHTAHPYVKIPLTAQRYLWHGWQSWSLACWTDLSPLPIPCPALLHPMQTDPVYVRERQPHGSWYGAVELKDGSIFFLGALGLGAHVRLDGEYLEGLSEVGEQDWLVAEGEEQGIFDVYSQLLSDRFGSRRRGKAPRVWCSWYSLYTAIDEKIINQIVQQLQGYPFDVIQIDDGWQQKVGDWLPNAKFPSGMETLATVIHSQGKKAGLWLAPFLAVKSARLFREHPQWFVKDEKGHFISAGINWGEPLYALDTTHPQVLEWLRRLMVQVRNWGFDYVKLDFLYAAALPGIRYQDIPREVAYRQGLNVIRQSLGEDIFLLACGAPIFPSLGLCDALRVGPDVSGEWENTRDAVILTNPAIPGARNAIRTTLHRLWLKQIIHIDPDVVYFSQRGNRLTPEQRRLLQDLAQICQFRATSELPQWLNKEEAILLKQYFGEEADVIRSGKYSYRVNGREVDFTSVIPLAQPLTGIGGIGRNLFCWIANHHWALKFIYWQSQRSARQLRQSLDAFAATRSTNWDG